MSQEGPKELSKLHDNQTESFSIAACIYIIISSLTTKINSNRKSGNKQLFIEKRFKKHSGLLKQKWRISKDYLLQY